MNKWAPTTTIPKLRRFYKGFRGCRAAIKVTGSNTVQSWTADTQGHDFLPTVHTKYIPYCFYYPTVCG